MRIDPLYNQYNRGHYWQEYLTDTSAVNYPQTKTCHGCDGKGWVTVSGQAQKCPVCGGSGKYAEWDGKFIYK